jgi:hypothetical protein
MLKFLRRIFNPPIKKPISKMTNYKELTPEELHEKFSELDFLWIKGDNSGDTERYTRIAGNAENTFVVFQSGNRINLDLIDEYMTSFPKSHESLNLNSVPAAPVATPFYQPLVQASVQSISYESVPSSSSDSPLFKLLEKRKKNMVDVSIKLKINLPSKDLYNVLIESFEGAEDEVIDYIISEIEIDEIKRSLSESIKKNYYQKSDAPKTIQSLKGKKAELEE